MKHIVSLLAVIIALWSTPSQTQARIFDNPDNGISAEMGFGISRVLNYPLDGGPYKESHTVGVIYTPRLSYRFNPNWSAGVLFRYDSNDVDSYKSYGAFAELSLLKIKSYRLRVFADMQYLYNDTDYGRNFTEIGLVPGIAFNIPGSPIDIKLRYLFVGFNDGYHLYKDVGGCLTDGDWMLDAGLRRLALGVAVNF